MRIRERGRVFGFKRNRDERIGNVRIRNLNRVAAVFKGNRPELLGFGIGGGEDNLHLVRNVVAVRVEHFGGRDDGPRGEFLDEKVRLGGHVAVFGTGSDRCRVEERFERRFARDKECRTSVYKRKRSRRHIGCCGRVEEDGTFGNGKLDCEVFPVEERSRGIVEGNGHLGAFSDIRPDRIDVETQIALFERRRNGIPFHVRADDLASAVVTSLGVRAVVVPRHPFHHVVPVGEILGNGENVAVVFFDIFRVRTEIGDAVAFEIVEKSGRGNLAFAGVSRRADRILDGCGGGLEWREKVERKRPRNGKVARRGIVVGRVAVDVRSVVKDRDVGDFSVSDFLRSVYVFEIGGFGTRIVRAFGEVDSLERNRIGCIFMFAERPGTFQILECRGSELELEKVLARNGECPDERYRQVVTAEAVALGRSKGHVSHAGRCPGPVPDGFDVADRA